LQQLSSNRYELSIEAEGYSSILHKWNAAILVDKLSEESYVELKAACIEVGMDYPIDILFEEYSLAGTSCQWINFQDCIYCPGTIVIINNKEELENYITCSDVNYSQIDFENYSLISATGIVATSLREIQCKELQQTSDNEYFLHLNMTLGGMTSVTRWFFAVIVSKLPQNAIVDLIRTDDF